MKEEIYSPLPFQTKSLRGAVKGKSCIAYSFDLKSLPTEAFFATEQFLDELCEKYLTFLQKESQTECDFVRFAGIKLEEAESSLALSVALCPFSEREYRPVAKLILDEKGNILDIKKEKRSRQMP